MYWMVECAMMNKYEYMKIITNMAKLFFYKKPGKNGTSFRLYDIIRFLMMSYRRKLVPFLPGFLYKKITAMLVIIFIYSYSRE